MIRTLALALCLIATQIVPQAAAAPEAYRLDTARSSVGFTYTLGQAETAGTMPVRSAEMWIDLANPSASRVTVTLDASRARAGVFFATEAMRGPQVLDTARHPLITFRSTRITGTLQAARVEGLVTLRGTTRPVTLTAGLYRQRGTEARDLDRLTVLLTGQINRHSFGASGFPDLVGPVIDLRIVARIER